MRKNNSRCDRFKLARTENTSPTDLSTHTLLMKSFVYWPRPDSGIMRLYRLSVSLSLWIAKVCGPRACGCYLRGYLLIAAYHYSKSSTVARLVPYPSSPPHWRRATIRVGLVSRDVRKAIHYASSSNVLSLILCRKGSSEMTRCL